MTSLDNLFSMNPQMKELIDAIQCADLNRVRSSIRKGALDYFADPSTENPLYYAALTGDTGIVNLLLKNRTDANSYYSLFRVPPLVAAVENGHKNVVEQLIAAGDKVNIGELGKTPLGMAAFQGHLEIMNILLQSGADINVCDLDGNTALGHAAQKQTNLHIMRHLLSMGADVNKFEDEGMTPLMSAIRFDAIENVKYLVENGADINIRDSKGMTAVDYAAKFKKHDHIIACFNKFVETRITLFDCIKTNNVELAKTLIANEANVNKPRGNGESPLECAVKTRNLEMIKLFLNNGAQFSIPLAFLAAIKTSKVEIVQLLIKSGADVNLQYRNGYTPLLQALEIENLEIVKLLLENGAHVVNHPLVLTVLTNCIQKKEIEMVKLLIEKGVSADFVSECGFTPLMKCVEMNSYQLLDFLVQKGADVNKTDSNKDTPLSRAAFNANFKMFDYLLKAGADLDQVKDKLNEVAKSNEDFAVYLDLLRRQNMDEGHKKITNEKNAQSSGAGFMQEEAPL